jgi:hypothetical protein
MTQKRGKRDRQSTTRTAAKESKSTLLTRRSAKTTAPQPNRETKQARLIALLQRPSGAAIKDLAAATGWQAHSVRGVMSGALKKRLGLTITSESGADGRVYHIASSDKAA